MSRSSPHHAHGRGQHNHNHGPAESRPGSSSRRLAADASSSAGAAGRDPREAVDVARSVATLMERLRQLKEERDAARRDADALRAELPAGHPLKNAPPPASSASPDTEAGAAATSTATATATGVDVGDGLETLRGELTQALADKEENLNLARRVQAEFDNYRKRIQRDMPNQRRDALRGFLGEFLAGFDDLDRVLAESEKDPAAATVREGVRLARENLWRAMEKGGVKAIPAQGQPFDPRFHDAMTTIPSADHPADTVLEVFQPGYMLDDFVLRPARVVLSAAPPTPPSPPSPNAGEDDKQDAGNRVEDK